MAEDFDRLSKEQLKNLIDNHRAKNATDTQRYLDILRAYELRVGKGLDFDKSLAIIKAAAERREFLSYKDLSDESGTDWSRVRYDVGPHLGRLIEYGHRKGWPMISAIVVNKTHKSTGRMEPDTLKGFVEAARNLGVPVTTNSEDFLKQQQEEVFSRAKDGW